MINLLKKELRLAVSPLSWLFLAFSAMTLLPGYPILMGAFFVCLGLFQTFLSARENGDVLYTVLLPVRKTDAVKARFITVCFFQTLAFIFMCCFTALRMTVLSRAAAYTGNALMNATPVFLAFALALFALFNSLFVCGFFRTAHRTGRPFVVFIIAATLLILAAESLHHIPGLGFLNTPSGERMGLQWAALAAAAAVYIIVTFLSERRASRMFEKLDL